MSQSHVTAEGNISKVECNRKKWPEIEDTKAEIANMEIKLKKGYQCEKLKLVRCQADIIDDLERANARLIASNNDLAFRLRRLVQLQRKASTCKDDESLSNVELGLKELMCISLENANLLTSILKKLDEIEEKRCTMSSVNLVTNDRSETKRENTNYEDTCQKVQGLNRTLID